MLDEKRWCQSLKKKTGNSADEKKIPLRQLPTYLKSLVYWSYILRHYQSENESSQPAIAACNRLGPGGIQ